MIEHAQQFAELEIPFIFDPGQGLPMFSGDELMTFLGQANYAVVNDYESQMLLDKTGLTLEQLAEKVETLIVTRGGQGSEIYHAGEMIKVASAPIGDAVDPTGCGDAYRAGVMHGITTGRDWKTCGQMGALCGAIKIEQSGTQNHSFTTASFAERYQQAFGESI
jgi:adenosine kinase